ncbi:MAG: MbtH family protein [Chloroflexi bacterium]|nr:MAG: MbtH family protein [Chloroflexota bacterium]
MQYIVVVNHEEQFAIWPADKELPLGWRAVGVRGYREECLAWIRENWTDMRPLSVRQDRASLPENNDHHAPGS